MIGLYAVALAAAALAQADGEPAAPQGADLAAGTQFKECADCPEMVVIPPGSFTMGAEGGEEGRYEGPVRDMHVARSFAIGSYPVTVGEFRRFVTKTQYEPATDCVIPQDGKYVSIKGADWRDPVLPRPVRDDDPVVCIDWQDAKAYVDWLAAETGKPYRLLSEAEWEYVARNQRDTLYPWGDDPEDVCHFGNVLDASAPRSAQQTGEVVSCSDGHMTLSPVGAFPRNRFGVSEMIGNVWTWVQDCYEMPYAASAPTDGSAYEGGACDRRSVRGASWATSVSRAHPSFRGRDPVDRVSQLFGLRVARDLPSN